MKNSTIYSRLAVVLTAVLLLLGMPHAAAQQNGDQRLITLNNGYQYLGYIVEQRPGKDLKLYRPAVNDTITVKLEDIAKVTRIEVKSTAQRPAKQTVAADTTKREAKYNFKPHVFQVSFLSGVVFQEMTDPMGPSLGFGLGYYYSFKNKWFLGGSFQHSEGYSQRFYVNYGYDNSYSWHTILNAAVAEGRMRISGKPQNRRMSTLLGVHAGYLHSYADFENYGVYREKYHIDAVNGFVAGTSVCFRINPDRNSGWSIEPMISSFRPRTSVYYFNSNGLVVSNAFVRNRYSNVAIRCSYYF